jgi:signal transduction histidine kinase
MFLKSQKIDFSFIYFIFTVFTCAMSAFFVYILMLYRKNRALTLIEKVKTERKAFETLLKSKEETLSIISRELHDNIGSRLFSLNLLSMEDNPAFFAGCPKHIIEWNLSISREIEIIMNDVRALSHEYAPYIQTVDNLNNALLSFISRINFKHNIDCQLIIESDRLYSIDKDLAIEIYRIVTELLKNIVSHSQASRASVRINTVMSDVKIEVEDNGVGLVSTSEKTDNGVGIRNIHTRVSLSGGKVNFADKENGNGTKIVIEMPFKY